jgi:hypothetical protein
MSVDEITNEETGRITGILEQKWAQMTKDNARLTAENQALNHALDVMTQDRNYWRERGQEGEKERDEARDDAEFMLRQWQGVQAIAKETMERVKGERARTVSEPHPSPTLAAVDKMPSVVVFNRQQ